jgi:hypothetical protein
MMRAEMPESTRSRLAAANSLVGLVDAFDREQRNCPLKGEFLVEPGMRRSQTCEFGIRRWRKYQSNLFEAHTEIDWSNRCANVWVMLLEATMEIPVGDSSCTKTHEKPAPW